MARRQEGEYFDVFNRRATKPAGRIGRLATWSDFVHGLLAVRVANPLPKGMPVRFANNAQDQHAFGWLTLLPVEWK